MKVSNWFGLVAHGGLRRNKGENLVLAVAFRVVANGPAAIIGVEKVVF